jgi:DNA-binding ferritin-like protein
MTQEVITRIFRTMVQSQICHWLTDNHQVHTILGELYEELQELVDTLAERHLSYTDMLSGEATIDIKYSYSDNDIIDCLVGCRETITEAISDEENVSVEDALISILTLLDTNIYLLGMAIKKN